MFNTLEASLFNLFFLCKLHFHICVSSANAFLVAYEEFSLCQALFASDYAFVYVFLVNVLEFILYAPLQLLAFDVYSDRFFKTKCLYDKERALS